MQTMRQIGVHEFLVWMIFALVAGFILSTMTGCGGIFSAGPLAPVAFKDGGNVVACGSNEKKMVDTALEDGKVSTAAGVVDWLSFIAYNLECVAPVVKDVYDAYKSAPSPTVGREPAEGPLIAGADPKMYFTRPSAEKMRRAHVADVLCRAAGVCK